MIYNDKNESVTKSVSIKKIENRLRELNKWKFVSEMLAQLGIIELGKFTCRNKVNDI